MQVAINDWNRHYVRLFEHSWGRKSPRYTLAMFSFALAGGDSWLDLGCGFGRFLRYLLTKRKSPNYIGYDSSLAMVERIRELYPRFKRRIFFRNIAEPLAHKQESILASAILIHLPQESQLNVLKNVAELKPKSFTFDINGWNSRKGLYFDTTVSGRNFLLIYQSSKDMLDLVKSLFHDYAISTRRYALKGDAHKTVFFLRRRTSL